MVLILESHAEGRWIPAGSTAREIRSAIDGRVVARCGGADLDFAAMARHARMAGGPALRRLTFHGRADLLKRLALHLEANKEELHALSFDTGTTRKEAWFDIDGGIATLFAYASRGRRELPDAPLLAEGPAEPLGKGGKFLGQHVLTPLTGVAVQVNAYNFPCWGLLEKLAPALLAGMPVIAKPATPGAQLAHALARLIIGSGLLPEGSFQFIAGGTGDLLDHLTGQDVLAFTGSVETTALLRNHPAVTRNAVRFVAERDSLNAALLGSDATPGTPEFDLFIREVAREMTVKAGQKCTAIRRILVPRALEGAVAEALMARLARIVTGDPRREEVTMGALAGLDQREEVRRRIALLRGECEILHGDPDSCAPLGADAALGAFMAPVLLRARAPMAAARLHDTEAFGPVATLAAYEDLGQAIELARRGEGSLVATICTADPAISAELTLGLAPFHGRLLLLDRDSAPESTGHGSPLPGLVHGGPGRAGGGEEMGGLRGVHHHMQRTALQGSPERIAALTGQWLKGAPERSPTQHPFRLDYDTLRVGDSIRTPARAITLEDIEHFAHFTGDTFYAHMDEAAARANPFFPGRVAHGYLILSFAAGLFVDPAPGPLLANYGLENLRFLKPVSPGDSIAVRLTVQSKSPARQPHYGEVRWDAEVFNQHGETVARYQVLTMSARPGALSAAAE
ncbi:phenylacetic acid degradation bifunctional protein PaaZ [Roseomonas sp. GC11]|uniref:phenylacetic acid degradation bifunctional protein PaaZ n=1 Tax=Roseomonas sp. GC11 TaxID=2950546 RepID=UPI00210A1E7B|nr:phenylacetic acid degradation bifunctional protein PaaZ [Roseomonas sp. GC11]MCQ4160026.1 phenylacetic acid degradation bifunctional protein PaaZ [Roseomonas sp. GC11]